MKKVILFIIFSIFNISFSYSYDLDRPNLCRIGVDKPIDEIYNMKQNFFQHRDLFQQKVFSIKYLIDKYGDKIDYKQAQKLGRKAINSNTHLNFGYDQVNFTLLFLKYLPKVQEHCNKIENIQNKAEYTGYNGTTGLFYKGNYIYFSAMDLAWNKLKDTIGEDIKIDIPKNEAIKYPYVKNFAKEFNNTPFTKNDLEKKDYYAKGGYEEERDGNNLIKEINDNAEKISGERPLNEHYEKFPTKEDIISYAFIKKYFEFNTIFSKTQFEFNYEPVEGFHYDPYSKNAEEQRKNLSILNYDNEDKFIIKLNNSENDLFLAKGYDMSSTKEVLDDLNKYKNNKLQEFGQLDSFSMPEISIDFKRIYKDISEQHLENDDFNDFLGNPDFDLYYIKKIFENNKFELNNKGIKLNNESVLGIHLFNFDYGSTGEIKFPEEKICDLNKPFWIIAKTHNSDNPYLIIGIINDTFFPKVIEK